MTNLIDSNALILLSIVSAGCIFALISVLAVCVCGCRKGAPKNDLLGLDGMVKITNPDENVNHLPAAGNYVSQVIGEPNISESDDSSKRPPGGSNPHRSLPDIPIYADGEVRIGSDNGVSGDTSSELYATVDDKIAAYSKRHNLANGIEPGPSLSHQSSISQTDSNYARLKENPYDKVKKSENPYANVQSSDSKENDESSREHSRRTSWNESTKRPTDTTDNVATTVVEVVITDHVDHRSRRSSAQSTIAVPANNNIVLQATVTPDIPAATAVAGRVAASQELPYMTPPITQPQHFSGDSQDSSRGYTSISVREPLANIIKQTPAIRNRRNDIDPHYSTVSDDSDEMYAAIVEPNSQIYMNGSETYAQIQPVTVAEIHGQPEEIEVLEDDDQYEPAPQPPSVDSLKHVAHVHSRQASSSSCTSSVANLGSPKPEKRQANSPLPPPPAVSPDLYARVDKPQEKDENHLSVARNLEDMYAKVQKNKKSRDESENPTKLFQNTTELSSIPFQKLTNQTDTHSKISWSSRESFEDCKNIDSISITSFDSDKESAKKKRQQEHCYETLNKSDKKSPRKSQNGETWLADFSNGPESLLSNDPGYEQLNTQNRAPSDIDPNYEVLRPHRTSSVSESIGYSTIGNDKSTLTVNPNYTTVPSTSGLTHDGYSVVNKSKIHDIDYEQLNNQPVDEPNYESMPSECDNYSTIHQKSTESESDPNYESVKYLDVSLSDPPYECLNDDETKDPASDLSEYEQISSTQNSSDIAGYERIKDSASKSSENSEDSGKLSNVHDGDMRSKNAQVGDNRNKDMRNMNGQSTSNQAVILNNVEIKEVNIIPSGNKEGENDIFHV